MARIWGHFFSSISSDRVKANEHTNDSRTCFRDLPNIVLRTWASPVGLDRMGTPPAKGAILRSVFRDCESRLVAKSIGNNLECCTMACH